MKSLVCLFLVVAVAVATHHNAINKHGVSRSSSSSSSSSESVEYPEAKGLRFYPRTLHSGGRRHLLRNDFINGLPDYLKASVLEIETQMPVERKPIGNLGDGEVRFFLYTQQKPTPTEIVDMNTHLIDKNKPMKFVIHGWLQSHTTNWLTSMKDQLLMKEDYSVILVDWYNPAYQVYGKSAAYTKKVGEFVANFALKAQIKLDTFHMIGFGMGAQVAGYAGKEIARQTVSKKPARISALDPAGPGFQETLYPAEDKLQKTDADYVDVTHSDSLIFGFYDKLGHSDFFPNGGERNQPGCFNSVAEEDGVNCSHTRSTSFFIESISSMNFVATKCNSWREFQSFACQSNPKVAYGYNSKPGTVGTYYFQTNAQSPFARG